MNFSFQQAISFAKTNSDALAALAAEDTMVICPSAEALAPLRSILPPSIKLGAQNCSAYRAGSYTSQIDARSLKEVGCSYAIIGHSEARRFLCEDDQQIAQKAIRLIEIGIQPIVCVGEPIDIYQAGRTVEWLHEQVEPVIAALAEQAPAFLCIAYEPIWAIGSGTAASVDYVEQIVQFLISLCTMQLPGWTISMLYGGSVDGEIAARMKQIKQIDGFLIGGASLDFQKFKKIVL